MAPNKFKEIRKYFKYDKKKNESYCKANKNDNIVIDDEILQCGKVLLGSKVSNLVNHLKKMHPKTYEHYCVTSSSVDTIKAKKPAAAPSSNEPSSTSSSAASASRSKKITNFISLKKKSGDIQITKQMLIRSLLSTVTVDGRPFCAIEDAGYSTFTKPVMKLFNLSYDRKSIAEVVEDGANFIRDALRKDLECNLVSIKVDCATRHSRSFLGMNVQVVKEGKIVVYCLAVKEILVRHTAENLKALILQELETYNILPKNIYTITSDSGANLVKAINLIEDLQHENNDNDTTEELEEDSLINDQLQDMIDQVDWRNEKIMGIRCLAHVLQLCVFDTLKNSWTEQTDEDILIHDIIETYLDVIRQARKVVKELRTQTILILLKEKRLRKPSLDVQTRWGSTYLMLQSLLFLKEFCSTCVTFGNTKLLLAEDIWEKIREIVLCLEPCYEATKKVQYHNNTLTDLYKQWHICHMKTANIGSPFSTELVTNMVKRRESLMENPVMLAAIYLDPRFSFELSEQQKVTAINHICSIQSRIMDLEEEQHNRDLIMLSSEDTTDSFGTEAEDDEALFEKVMKNKHQRINCQQPMLLSTFKNNVTDFSKCDRLPSTTNILKFWHENKTHPCLKKQLK